MKSYKTEAIIINRLNLGESDRILTLFSPEFGKIRAVCKGARKTKSKFGGHTELFSHGNFVLSAGKSLDILSDAILINNFLASDPDIEKVRSAYYFAEIINKLLPDNAPNPEIYSVYLHCLENMYVIDIDLLQLIFISKVLKSQGVYPELSNCVKCEQKPDRGYIFFSKMAGGITDRDCSKHFEDSIQTDEKVVKLWRYITDTNVELLKNIVVDNETIKSANTLAISYIHCVTMIDYKSLQVLS